MQANQLHNRIIRIFFASFSLLLVTGCGQFSALLFGPGSDPADLITAKVENEAPAFEGADVEFVIRLSGPSSSDIQLFYEATDGSAEAGIDFPEAVGSVVIPAGQTQVTMKVPTTRRPGIQGNRTMQLTITSTTGCAKVATPVAEGEIKDIQASPGLFKDLNLAPLKQNIGRLNDSTILFFAYTEAHGNELWKSDGTASGTRMVKDINPGPASSVDSTVSAVRFVEYAGKIYFRARTDDEGVELWSTDGTDLGTTMLPTPAPGPESGYYSGLLVAHGFLYFAGGNTLGTQDLYRTDGTAVTKVTAYGIMDGWPGVQGELAFAGTRVVFNGYCSGGWNLCGYNGTVATTLLSGAGLQPAVFWSCGGKVYFRSNAGSPYSTNGTAAGTVKLNSNSSMFVACSGGTAFFTSTTAGEGTELWKTLGTVISTSIVKDIVTGAGSVKFGNPIQPFYINDTGRDSYVSDSVSVSPKILFTADDLVNGFEPHFSDGTLAGTNLLKNIQPGALNSFSGNYYFDASTNLVYFAAEDQVSGTEVWQSDFTAGGTIQILDLVSGPMGSMPVSFFRPGPGAPLFFLAVDSQTSQSRLFITNGTPAGTSALPAVVPNRSSGMTMPLALSNGSLIFGGDDGSWGQMLWKSLGRPDSLEKIVDLLPNGACTPIANQIAVGNIVYFTRTDTVTGDELWRTDGTATGTMLVKDINPGLPSASPSAINVLGHKIVFTATTSTDGKELWISDGTGFGTSLILDINPGIGSSNPRNMTVVENKMYFAASEPLTGSEPWITDGTALGTFQLKDIDLGADSSDPQRFTAAAGKVFFSAHETVTGRELWATDGTSLGTSLVLDIEPGAQESIFSENASFKALGDKLLFTAFNSASGEELWISDGTALGTNLLSDLRPGPASSYPSGYTIIGTKVVFRARVPSGGDFLTELVVTDGTTLGTSPILLPGISKLDPWNFTAAGSTVFFTGDTPATGTELWKTKGTLDTTMLVKEHRPGTESSTFGAFKYADGVLFYTVNSPLEGTELFVAHPD